MPFEAIIAAGANTGFDYPWVYSSPRLFQYAGSIYHFTSDPTGALFSVWKSVNLGQNWTRTATITPSGGAISRYGAQLVGTRVYIWYEASGFATALSYYDFTTDTFTTVTTTGTITLTAAPSGMLMAGPDAAHLFTFSDDWPTTPTITASEYLSNVVTSIGTITEVTGNNVPLQTCFLGSSGIIHVFYVRQSGTTSIDLKYFNVNAGVLSSPVTVIAGTFSDHFVQSGSIAPPVQIGSNIYFSFYSPSAQKVKLCTFGDVASPSFSFSDIEPTWALTASSSFGTGQYISALSALVGSLLICFYVNTNKITSGAVGDGILYCRTSPDAGVTWSPAQQVIAHIDPSAGTAKPILAPCVLNQVAVTFPFNPLFCSYMQNPQPATGDFDARFVMYCPAATPPPPPPPVIVGGWLVGGG